MRLQLLDATMRRRALSFALLTAFLADACTRASNPAGAGTAPAERAASLKAAFSGAFVVGAALNARQFSGGDPRGAALVEREFNTVSPENVLKWEVIHPRRGVYDFSAADRYVDYATSHGMFVVGHTLVWHSQVPRWVFEDASGKPLGRDSLLAVMREHISTVVGRYKGRIKGWDVANEVLNEDGTMRQSAWMRGIGDDYVAKAFEFAHQADPAAELYYNDYSLENAPKRNGAVSLIRRLQAAGVTVTAIGSQSHNRLDWPTAAQCDSTIRAFAALGIHVNITELDVDVLPRTAPGQSADVALRGSGSAASNPYAGGLPDSLQWRLGARYAELFRVYERHRDVIDRVTFWGVGDGDSWLNDWPVRGRTSYPLLFDRNGLPKPAYDSVMAVAASFRRPR